MYFLEFHCIFQMQFQIGRWDPINFFTKLNVSRIEFYIEVPSVKFRFFEFSLRILCVGSATGWWHRPPLCTTNLPVGVRSTDGSGCQIDRQTWFKSKLGVKASFDSLFSSWQVQIMVNNPYFWRHPNLQLEFVASNLFFTPPPFGNISEVFLFTS